jgi:hypothetical protein
MCVTNAHHHHHSPPAATDWARDVCYLLPSYPIHRFVYFSFRLLSVQLSACYNG